MSIYSCGRANQSKNGTFKHQSLSWGPQKILHHCGRGCGSRLSICPTQPIFTNTESAMLSSHHWHWSLLCLQSAEWLEGVQLQSTSQRDTGGRAKFQQPLNFKAFVIQVKTGAPLGVGIKNVTPRLDKGLKVILDRNFDRCTRSSLSNKC